MKSGKLQIKCKIKKYIYGRHYAFVYEVIVNFRQGYVMNYTEAENLVREATNEDPWGPTGPQMKEICHLTFQ